MRRASIAAMLASLALPALPAAAGAAATAGAEVDCDADPGALAGPAGAIAGASAGDILRITGRCLGAVTIDKSLTLRGKSGRTVLDGNGAGPVVTVAPGVSAVLEKLTVTGGVATGQPVYAVGGILNDRGDLTLRQSAVVGNSATAPVIAVGGIQTGGAPFDPGGGSLKLEKSTVSENDAVVTGGQGTSLAAGGINEVSGAATTLVESAVRGNTAAAGGAGPRLAFGGISSAGSLSLERSDVRENVAFSTSTVFAGGVGGVIAFLGGRLTMEKTAVRGNSVVADGPDGIGAGGVAVGAGARAVLSKSTVSGNAARAPLLAGGGINNLVDGALALDRTDVTGNEATVTAAAGVAAGGLSNGFSGGATTTLAKSVVSGNVAAAPGGGAVTGGVHDFLLGGGVTLTVSSVTGNTPPNCNFAAAGC